VFQADGAGGITSTGSLDINDNGIATSITGFDPTNSSYAILSDGSGTLTLFSGATPYNFAIYVVGGKTQNSTNPLTLFAISNDGPTSHAAVGTIVFQDPTPTYDKSALNGFSVSNLTGVSGPGSASRRTETPGSASSPARTMTSPAIHLSSPIGAKAIFNTTPGFSRLSFVALVGCLHQQQQLCYHLFYRHSLCQDAFAHGAGVAGRARGADGSRGDGTDGP